MGWILHALGAFLTCLATGWCSWIVNSDWLLVATRPQAEITVCSSLGGGGEGHRWCKSSQVQSQPSPRRTEKCLCLKRQRVAASPCRQYYARWTNSLIQYKAAAYSMFLPNIAVREIWRSHNAIASIYLFLNAYLWEIFVPIPCGALLPPRYTGQHLQELNWKALK